MCGSIRIYNLHQFFHRNSTSISFKCVYKDCYLQFSCYAAFKSHTFRDHHENNKHLKSTSNFYVCSSETCSYKANDFSVLKKHIYEHIRQKQFLTCPLKDSCKTETLFKVTANIQNHFFRKHSIISNEKSDDQSVETLLDDDAPSCSIVGEKNEEINLLELSNIQNYEELSLKLLSHLLISLESKYLVSKTALQALVRGITDVINLNSKYIYTNLSKRGISQVVLSDIEKDLFFAAFNSKTGLLKTNWCREKYYKTNFSFVAPIEIQLNDGKKESCLYYVPILQTLKTLLKNKIILEQCLLKKRSTNGIFADLTDGQKHRASNFFQQNNILQIILYQDAFEVCNPLGSSRIKHKVVGIYMVLGNLPPWQRSKTDQIQLVSLCYEKDIKYYGWSIILKNIIDDLKVLETVGIQVNNITFKGSVIFVLGDNLGSHSIGGFIEKFDRKKYFCRFCYIYDLESDVAGTTVALRTEESYNVDVDQALTTDEICRGVKFNSPLNDLEFYHVATGLPPCLAHDLLEGIVPFDICLIINKVVSKKIVSFEYINLQLKKIKFSVGVKTISIPDLKKSEKLIGTASQNLYLLYILPFILFEKGEHLHSESHWILLLLLRNIVQIVMSFQISEDQLAVLKYLIREYIFF